MLFRAVRTLPVAHPRLVRFVLTMAWIALAVWAFARRRGADDAPAVETTMRSAIGSVFSGAPDEVPVMVNAQPPFRYPAALYAQRVQGNVTLRLFVDSTGAVHSDSTHVEEPSGNAALDSAAVAGARNLRFTPARRRGAAIAVSLLYPVYFRHPEAEPLPGDSVLRPRTP